MRSVTVSRARISFRKPSSTFVTLLRILPEKASGMPTESTANQLKCARLRDFGAEIFQAWEIFLT